MSTVTLQRRKPIGEKLSKFRTLTQMYERLFPTCADRMWAVRHALEMTQGEFAELCGLSHGWTSRIECGYGLPKGTTLEKIVTATGLSADFILGVEGKVDNGVIRHAERVLEAAEEEMRRKRRALRAGGQ